MKNNKINQKIFDGSTQNYLMRNNGFSVGFNMPPALSGENTFGLPPYAKRMPYLVDKYPACPKEWMRSEGIVKSFFVPVIEGNGMWLDFNENENHTHHIAIVISVQGINPITGMPCRDAQLEQYIEECPKHNIKFGPDRYCSKCDYKWSKQNYITTTATPRGLFWLDGFRTVEGVVRQYILTAEKMRGVASNIIGKDRVYAIGLSFFVSKEKRQKPIDDGTLRGNWPGSVGGQNFFSPIHIPIDWTVPGKENDIYYGTNTATVLSDNTSDNTMKGGTSCSNSSPLYENSASQYDDTLKPLTSLPLDALYKKNIESNMVQCSGSNVRSVQTKKLEIGAGAKINQSVYDDPERLDFWHDKPESIICINHCTENDAIKIIEQGEINIEGHKEGFLKEIPVGN